MPGYELRAIDPAEVEAFVTMTGDAFQDDPNPDSLAHWAARIDPERTLAAFHDGEVVGTSAIHPRRIVVPGGGLVAMGGISAVGVAATHRGRGLLDRMMRGQLEALHERGEEPVSGLWASEAGIYGRYGFGLATRNGRLRVRSAEARLRAPAERRLRAVEPEAALAELIAVYEAVWTRRAGMLDRDERDWEHRLFDPESRRGGAGRLRGVIQDGPDGAAAGYALFAVRKRNDEERPDDVVELRELMAVDPAAAAALWEHLLRMALARSVTWGLAPLDEPLAHMITDVRAATTGAGDALYVRVVDVGAALSQRTYTAPVDVVLEVADPLCPWNEGRWRLAGDRDGATCERTDAAADLALGAEELGACYLGGTALATLADAGRVQERTAGALTAASGALKGVREPWCPEIF
jgi:predicted acetyltransferase